jgi:hypothetical protein
MQSIRSHLSFANAISVIALFVALGGASYAAVTLPKNSVTAKSIKKNAVGASEIKKNAVRSGEVKNGSLRAGDFGAGQLPAGAKGDKGDKGDNGEPGTPGTARAFARISASGTLVGGADQSKGITLTMVQKDAGAPGGDGQTTGPGVYCFGGLGFDPTSAVVALDNTDTLPALPAVQGGSLNFIPSVAIFKGEDLGRCNGTHGQARVAIQRVDQTNPPELVNHGFFIWFEG